MSRLGTPSNGQGSLAQATLFQSLKLGTDRIHANPRWLRPQHAATPQAIAGLTKTRAYLRVPRQTAASLPLDQVLKPLGGEKLEFWLKSQLSSQQPVSKESFVLVPIEIRTANRAYLRNR